MRAYQGDFRLLLALVIGTGVGLIVKYYLDKRYIFHWAAGSATRESDTFMLYAVTGLVTTGIFWGFEFLFDYLVGPEVSRQARGCAA